MGNKKVQHKNNKSKQQSHANFKMLVQVPQLRVRLPYYTFLAMNEGVAGAGTSYSFAINNIFDPDFTGGGLQPLGFDQYAQFYGRYRVTGFSAEVTYSNRIPVAEVVGVYFSPQSTLPSVPSAWPVVNSTSQSKLIGSLDGMGTVQFKVKANLPDVFGVTANEYRDDMDFAATTVTGPARQGYMHVYLFGRSGSTVASVDFTVKLYYDVEFSQSVALSLS